jgi:uncharacterized integral membrane protein
MTKPSKARMIIGIVIGAVGALIALQNLQSVDTNVLLWRFTMPHVLLLAIMLGAGFVLGVTVSVMLGAKYLNE